MLSWHSPWALGSRWSRSSLMATTSGGLRRRSFGGCEIQEVSPAWRVRIEKEIMLYLAGFEAELRFDPEGDSNGAR